MSASVANEFEHRMSRYAHELKDFLERLPRNLKRGKIEQAKEQCQKLVDELPHAKEEASWAASWAKFRAALVELNRSLDGKTAKAYVQTKYDEAARAYEHWVATRRAASKTGEQKMANLGALKPLIGARSTFHMSSGLVCFVLYQFLLTRWQAELVLLSVLGVFGALELTRRFSGRWNKFLTDRVFHSIARPREFYKVNSSTLYVAALALLTPVFSREAVLCGVLILAFGDPAAAWIGRRWGRVKLYQSKSVVGSLAFVVTGTLVTTAFLAIFYSHLSLEQRLLASVMASVAGSAAEVFSHRLDDNLTIPIASVLVAALFL